MYIHTIILTIWAIFFTNASGHPGFKSNLFRQIKLWLSVIGTLRTIDYRKQFDRIFQNVFEFSLQWMYYCSSFRISSRVARWFVSNQTPGFSAFCKPFEWKILICFMSRCTLWSLASFYGNLAYLVAIRFIIPILVYYTKKNLATLVSSRKILCMYVPTHAYNT
jgi:hypothetical protein